MPWTTSDVDRFKQGLTEEQKKKWVAIANNVLKGCLAAGGTDESCAPQAIKIANSRV